MEKMRSMYSYGMLSDNVFSDHESDKNRFFVASFSDRKSIYLAHLSWQQLSYGKRTLLRPTMSAFEGASSCVMRSERLSV